MTNVYRGKLGTKVGHIVFDELLYSTDNQSEIELLDASDEVELVTDEAEVNPFTEKLAVVADPVPAVDPNQDMVNQTEDVELIKLREAYIAKFNRQPDNGYEMDKKWLKKKLEA